MIERAYCLLAAVVLNEASIPNELPDDNQKRMALVADVVAAEESIEEWSAKIPQTQRRRFQKAVWRRLQGRLKQMLEDRGLTHDHSN